MDFRSRGGLFQRPKFGDDRTRKDEGGRTVKSKPIQEKFARKLAGSGASSISKDFVTATHSQADFYGKNTVLGGEAASKGRDEAASRPLTEDEKNRLSARILKAEMTGNKGLVEKLKKKLEAGVTSEGGGGAKAGAESEGDEKEVLLTRTDKRTGITMPVKSVSSTLTTKCLKEDEKNSQGSTLRDLVAEEKQTTAEDQIEMFGELAAKMKESEKITDDWSVDDVFVNRKRKKGQDQKEEERKRSKAVKDHQRMEQTLNSCRQCLESSRFSKETVVAVGLKTYLSVPSHESLVDGHCYITPMSHVSSSVQMDEDIYAEMMIWRKGLVALFGSREEDCIFIESAKNVNQQPHMRIECIPVPKETGDSAPIYFKKALLDSETEWSDNKKVVDLSKRPLRNSIPRGFSYFAVDFGHQNGYAHVIENEHLFPSYFGKEIVGGMLDLNHNLWRKPQKESFDVLKKKVKDMKAQWAPFDWTERVKSAIREDD